MKSFLFALLSLKLIAEKEVRTTKGRSSEALSSLVCRSRIGKTRSDFDDWQQKRLISGLIFGTIGRQSDHSVALIARLTVFVAQNGNHWIYKFVDVFDNEINCLLRALFHFFGFFCQTFNQLMKVTINVIISESSELKIFSIVFNRLILNNSLRIVLMSQIVILTDCWLNGVIHAIFFIGIVLVKIP